MLDVASENREFLAEVKDEPVFLYSLTGAGSARSGEKRLMRIIAAGNMELNQMSCKDIRAWMKLTLVGGPTRSFHNNTF